MTHRQPASQASEATETNQLAATSSNTNLSADSAMNNETNPKTHADVDVSRDAASTDAGSSADAGAHASASAIPVGDDDFDGAANDFDFVEAIYRDKGVPEEHRGNKFIEALPPVPDDADLRRSLSYLPPFSPEERQQPAAMRIQLAAKVSRIFVALPRVVDIARAMLCMLHEGYADRAPGSKSDREIRRSLYAQQQQGDFACTRVYRGCRQMSFSLSGSSGSGKTFTIENLIAKLPPVIYHKELGRWQVPFAHVEMSHDGKSAHALATQLAEEFDRLMPDAGFVSTFLRKGRNAEERLFQVLRAAYEHGLGMLIVDEAQNQRSLANEEPRQQRKKAGASAAANETPLMKLLITAANKARVPLMFVGTTEFAGAVGTRFTKARRTAGNGSAVWAPLKRAPKGKTGQFEILLRVLFRYQWTHQVVEYSDEWADIFFEFSQGIPDVLVKLWKSAQVRAIGGTEVLTRELVEQTFDAEFNNVKFGLTALKNRDRLKLDVVSDLWSEGLDVEGFTKMEFDVPVHAVPLGKPMPVVAARGPGTGAAGTEAGGTAQSTAAAKEATPATKAKPRKEPPAPRPAEVDSHVAASADLRGITPDDIGTHETAKLPKVIYGQAPDAPVTRKAA